MQNDSYNKIINNHTPYCKLYLVLII